MDTAWISAFSAVMGSLVGAFTSFVTTYANQRAQYRRDFLSRQFAQRETLYSEFINEAARLQVDSLDHQMEQPSTLVQRIVYFQSAAMPTKSSIHAPRRVKHALELNETVH